ncbi:pentatricopeptide repeat-containing protein At1g06140, mitochondrial-like [Cryptomeria japonica]|uniref:pentatricopeptide repeat-containing protein At1g06140, mitochondrial-like n=1 Tax=Cryptomeria japonica TaxID=3369 RepID=UPI0025ABAD10|nr:pentatricopeptide repeat-containing protein At1g06140, mitochondrial-like [Cryptomeria japonica]
MTRSRGRCHGNGFKLLQKDKLEWKRVVIVEQVKGLVFVRGELRVDVAHHVFDRMTNFIFGLPTGMAVGFVQNDQGEEAVNLFRRMLREGVKVDLFPYASTLKACASIAILEQEKQVHPHIAKVEMRWLPKLGVILLTCIKTNAISFVGILFSCSQCGLIDEGHHYFDSVSQEHGLIPEIEHYVCMVDLLGRSGHLDEAEEFIKKMPVKPNGAIWGAFLGACRIHGNIEMGRRAAECLLDLRSQDTGSYILMSNIYSTAGSDEPK